MIKKILWLLTFVWLTINCMYWDVIQWPNYTFISQTFPLNQNVTVSDLQWNSFIFRKNANFEYWTNWNKVFSFYGGDTALYPSLRTFFRTVDTWNVKWLYNINSCEGWYSCSNIHTAIQAQWFVKSFCLTWYLGICDSYSYDAWLFYNWQDYSNPDSLTFVSGYKWITDSYRNYQYAYLCFNYQSFNKSACFYFNRAYPTSNWQNWKAYWYNPFWNDLSLAEFKNFITTSPFQWNWQSNSNSDWSTSVVFNNSTIQDVVDYFEQNPNYRFSKEICYVWTNDLTSPYWTSWLSYTYWKWKTIFELYESIYWTWHTDENVWVWINSRILNWQQWFLTSPEKRLYLADYTGWNLVLRYENLTFPFANKPVAIYFMTNELMDNHVGDDWNQWYQFAVYCDYVLNWENAEEITKDYVKNNIETFIDTRNKNVWKYQNPGWDVNSWFWSRLGVYDNTWDKQDFTSNFKNFFNKWTWQFDNYDNSLTAIIPDYILGFLVLLLLFKFLKRF